MFLFYFFASILFVSCSKEADSSWSEGSWELIEWNLDFDVDEGIRSINLLDEIQCSYRETLVFDSINVFTSTVAYQPQITANTILNSDELFFNIECGEGIISVTGLHYAEKTDLVEVNDDIVFLKEGNTLVEYPYTNIVLYNNDFTEIIDTLTAKKIFRKQD